MVHFVINHTLMKLHFLSRFLVENYILSPETITRKVAIFQTQQLTDSSTTPP